MKPLHVFYATSDTDAPLAIRDNNGEVVLQMCRTCGKAEVELDSPFCDLAAMGNQTGRDTAEVEGVLHFTPNTNVPRGVAVAIHNNRVLFLGAANKMPNQATINSWPDGTAVNVDEHTYRAIHKKVSAKVGG